MQKIFVLFDKLRLLFIWMFYKIILFFSNKIVVFMMALFVILLGILSDSAIVLIIYSAIAFYFITCYKTIGDFIVVNVYKGSIHMNANLNSSAFKDCTSDFHKLDVLVNGFISEINLIPSKVKFAPFLLFRKSLYTNTNEIVFKKLFPHYGDLINYEITDNGSMLYEKFLFIKPFDVFKDKCYSKLKRKVKKYKISFSYDDLKSASLVMKSLNDSFGK